MNLFKPCFKENSFDVLISNGCLHHTSDPKKAFSTVSKILKKWNYNNWSISQKWKNIY